MISSKILISGGAGFIGSHLADALLELGHEVWILDNLSSGLEKNINPKSKFVNGDVRSKEISSLFERERFDFVYHLAAQINLRSSCSDPTQDADVNIIGSLNVITNSLRTGVKKLIFASTGTVYHHSAELPWCELTPTQPASPYALAKLTVENYLSLLKELHPEFDFTVLRFSNVYGPRQNAASEAGVIAIFMENLKAGRPLKIFGDGNQTRDFIYVSDVVEANIRALELSGFYNVATGVETSVNEILNLIQTNINFQPEIIYEAKIPGEVPRIRLSSRRLQKKNWSPKIKLEEGIKLTRDYFL